MPIYDVECQNCHEEYEIIKNINEEIICKYCDSKDVKKLIGNTTFILNGDGWARDGYNKGGK